MLASGVDKLHIWLRIISFKNQANKQTNKQINKHKVFQSFQWPSGFVARWSSWKLRMTVRTRYPHCVGIRSWYTPRLTSQNLLQQTNKQTNKSKKFSRILIDLVVLQWDGLPENCSWQWALVTPIVLASGVDKLHVWLRSGMQRQTSQSLSCPYLLPYQ